MSNRLFILAHPDDEMLCLPMLFSNSTQNFQNNFFLYLISYKESSVREDEKLRASIYLKSKVPGYRLVIPEFHLSDGNAWNQISSENIAKLIVQVSDLQISQIVSFAYEGGHQDHDLAHVISKILQIKIGSELIEFSGYRLSKILILLKVSSPIEKMSFVRFRRFLILRVFIRLAFIHKSQYRVWLVLGPMMILKFLFRPCFTSRSIAWEPNQLSIPFLYQFRNKASRSIVEGRFQSLYLNALKDI